MRRVLRLQSTSSAASRTPEAEDWTERRSTSISSCSAAAHPSSPLPAVATSMRFLAASCWSLPLLVPTMWLISSNISRRGRSSAPYWNQHPHNIHRSTSAKTSPVRLQYKRATYLHQLSPCIERFIQSGIPSLNLRFTEALNPLYSQPEQT